MQHNLTCTALALIPFSLAAESNPTICCKLSFFGCSQYGGGNSMRCYLWTLCFKVCLLKIQLISVTIPPLIKYLTAACIWMNASYQTGRCSLPHVESALSSLLSPSHTLPHTSESLCLAESRMMRAGREEFCPVENRPPGSESLWHFYRLWAFSTYLSLQLRAESAPEWDF